MFPLLGTTLGAACVFFMRHSLSGRTQKTLNGFAAGIMTAASVWSLLIPSMEQSDTLGRLAFIPAVAGFWIGILFLMILDRLITRIHSETGRCGTLVMALAVTLHNIPEGMAVGILFAGVLSGFGTITVAEALMLSIGISIQNFPEGAIISMPLHADGMGKTKAFIYGTLSGIVEPIAAVITILVSGLITPLLPYMLSFAAGAMIYVTVDELIPEMSAGKRNEPGAIAFTLGFTLMMALDVALG